MSGGDRPRVAIFGGDERVARLQWSGRLDVRHYPYKSNRARRSLEDSLASGSVDHLVLLTEYMGHSDWHLSKVPNVNVIKWSRSPMQLMREIDTLIPPPRPTYADLVSPPAEGSTTNAGPPVGRRIVVPPPPAPVQAAPPVIEFALQFDRLLKKEGMSQTAFAKLVGCTSSAVSAWARGRAVPSGPYAAAVVKLLPEIAAHLKTRPSVEDGGPVRNAWRLLPRELEQPIEEVPKLVIRVKTEEDGSATANGRPIVDMLPPELVPPQPRHTPPPQVSLDDRLERIRHLMRMRAELQEQLSVVEVELRRLVGVS